MGDLHRNGHIQTVLETHGACRTNAFRGAMLDILRLVLSTATKIHKTGGMSRREQKRNEAADSRQPARIQTQSIVTVRE